MLEASMSLFSSLSTLLCISEASLSSKEAGWSSASCREQPVGGSRRGLEGKRRENLEYLFPRSLLPQPKAPSPGSLTYSYNSLRFPNSSFLCLVKLRADGAFQKLPGSGSFTSPEGFLAPLHLVCSPQIKRPPLLPGGLAFTEVLRG